MSKFTEVNYNENERKRKINEENNEISVDTTKKKIRFTEFLRNHC